MMGLSLRLAKILEQQSVQSEIKEGRNNQE